MLFCRAGIVGLALFISLHSMNSAAQTVPILGYLTNAGADPARLAEFWATALGYSAQAPPPGFASWPDFLQSRGLPESDTGFTTHG